MRGDHQERGQRQARGSGLLPPEFQHGQDPTKVCREKGVRPKQLSCRQRRALGHGMETFAANVRARPLAVLAATNLATGVAVGIYVKGKAEGGVRKLLKKMLFSLVFTSLKAVASKTVSQEQDKLKQKTKVGGLWLPPSLARCMTRKAVAALPAKEL